MALGNFRFQPLGKRVLVKMEELPTQIGTMHVVPMTGHNADRSHYGRLMAKGNKSRCNAVVGNRVIVNPYVKIDVKVDGIPFAVFDDHNVLGVVEEPSQA